MIGDYLILMSGQQLLFCNKCTSLRCFLWSDAGGALLVSPVTDPGVQEVQLLLPGSAEVKQATSDDFRHTPYISVWTLLDSFLVFFCLLGLV